MSRGLRDAVRVQGRWFILYEPVQIPVRSDGSRRLVRGGSVRGEMHAELCLYAFSRNVRLEEEIIFSRRFYED